MRCLRLLILSAAMLPAADYAIDHVTVAGASTKDLQARLATAGLTAVFGGAHNNKTTEMSLVSFPDGSYLELIAVQAGAGPELVERHEWAPFLKTEGVPCAWALRAKDLAAEVSRLKAAGVEVSPPVSAGRLRPDGVRLEWQTAQAGPEARGTFLPFFIQDLTPRDRRVYPQGKPVTRDYKGVSKVVIAVRNLDTAVKRYRQAFGAPEPIRQVDQEMGAHLALMGGVPAILAQPLSGRGWLAEWIDRFGEVPCAFVLIASRPDRVRGATESRWFGARIGWFDAEKLGWRLGVTAQ